MESSPPHTLQVIQQEKPKKRETGDMVIHVSKQEEDPELEWLVSRARLTTAVQFYDKDDQAGLTEIGPTGLPAIEAVPKAGKRTGPKVEPIMEEIPPWSQNSLKQHTGKVKETLTLLQQGKEEAKIFIGNNTKERNGKDMVAGMLHKHLQKISNVSLKRNLVRPQN